MCLIISPLHSNYKHKYFKFVGARPSLIKSKQTSCPPMIYKTRGLTTRPYLVITGGGSGGLFLVLPGGPASATVLFRAVWGTPVPA